VHHSGFCSCLDQPGSVHNISFADDVVPLDMTLAQIVLSLAKIAANETLKGTAEKV